QYSKTNPQWIEELMKELVLSPLAQREGNKYLAKANE
ncbi:DNA alkylation repair protein, partial [Enterococcus faecalis]